MDFVLRRRSHRDISRQLTAMLPAWGSLLGRVDHWTFVLTCLLVLCCWVMSRAAVMRVPVATAAWESEVAGALGRGVCWLKTALMLRATS